MKRTKKLQGKPAIVVPTNRSWEFFLEFLYNWEDDFAGCHLIIVEDREKKTFDKMMKKTTWPFTYDIYDWRDIDKELGKNAWVIPRKTDSIRSYGFLKAWQGNALFVVTLDDDVAPQKPGHHIQEFGKLLLETKEGPDKGFFSTLKDVRPRGTPWVRHKVKLAHGMWLENPDLGGETQLSKHETYTSNYGSERFNEGIVPAGCLFSVCSMNLAWSTDLTREMYFNLMGVEKYGFDRYGDIFTGYHVKRYLDQNGFSAHTGEPYVIHQRASNVWSNIDKEKNGLDREFWLQRLPEKDLVDEEYFQQREAARSIWNSFFTEE